MSTALIIAIAVVAVLLIAVLAGLFSPAARNRRRQRELTRRRDEAASAHRAQAEFRTERADQAQKRADLAAAEANRERAEAELHRARAELHEEGLADHELDSGHDGTAGTTETRGPADGETDRNVADNRQTAGITGERSADRP